MFKREFKNISQKLDRDDIAECEVCGCLVYAKAKNKGESKIVKTDVGDYCFGYVNHYIKEEIQQTYYCKIHKPKK